MELYIEQLKEQDAEELFAFECSNRAFFEKTVPSRGEDYYTFETFQKVFYELLQEQFERISYFHLIRNDEGTIVGRINLVDIEKDKELGYLGYRIGEKYAGRGIATKGVTLLLAETANYHVTEIHAKTTTDNIASQKVLEKSNFSRISIDENVDQTDFIHYIWKHTN
ncbi:GNAT family N-acetyltransferase [Bacillus cereus group sp. BfR-BA-01380]|uniref:GNAT family N-acetyltransferase n=1 Tax=Bacillus cereus group sp. BfR-BA-01380 TaxID=2920324 RepID=UPI001F56C0F0|nr:GNAT family N-acetyltransferase [Bacillus cereus group sp. BfR-BA-01380]